MKKMKGIIDPYTLGFIIALIGSSGAFLVHKNDKQEVKHPEPVVVDSASTDKELDFSTGVN